VKLTSVKDLQRKRDEVQAKSVAQLVLLSAIWGTSFVLIRIAGECFPPFWIALLRSCLGAGLLWTALLVTRQQRPARRYLPWLGLVALFNNAIPFTCFAWGERYVPSNIAAVLNATTPIFTLLIALGKKRSGVSNRVVFGVLLGFSGVLLAVRGQKQVVNLSSSGVSFAIGIALITAGALGYAIASIIAKAKLQAVSPIGIAAYQLILAAAMVGPFAWCGPHPSNVSPKSLLAVAALGLVGSGFAFLLFFRILRTEPATHAVAVTYLLPLWGLLWGKVAHEPVGVTTCAGVLVVLAGLCLLNWSGGQALTPAPSSVARLS
jgi:drug/metabolite transporter (DMT)-like permease